MTKYSMLSKKIHDFIEKDDVILNDEYISAYDLYSIITNELQELRQINRKSSFIPKDCNLKINSNIDDKYSKLDFYFKKKSNGCCMFIRSINKNRITSEFSFNKKEDLEFMKEYEDEIKYIFEVKEKIYDIYNLKKEKNTKLFNDGFLDVIISYNQQGETDITIRFNDLSNIHKLIVGHWYLYWGLLGNISKRKEDILKKFKISINDLDDDMKKMVENHINKQNIKIRKRKA